MNELSMKWTDAGPGPAVLLVHGFPLDGRVWDGVARQLAGSFRVIVPDLPGFGTSKVDGPIEFTMDELAGALHGMVRSIGLKKYVLAGLSMGGYVALAYAKKYEAELAGLVLVDTRSGADTPEGKAGRDKMVELVRQSGSSAVAAQMLPKMTSPGAKPEVVEQLKQIMESCPANAIAAACVAMRDRPDYTPVLGKLNIPTLVVVGEHDVITSPALAREMHGNLPEAQRTLTVVPDAGHMSPIEQPDAVAGAISSWLKF